MRYTDQTLLEQLKITRREIARRKEYLRLTAEDSACLAKLKDLVTENIDSIVEEFYLGILPFDEMEQVIGDAETLHRLKNHQRHYIISMFDGEYDEDYVHARLRVGVVHRRIGVSPTFYLAAVHNLSNILRNLIAGQGKEHCTTCVADLQAVDKIIMFDLTLVFDTYINSLMDEAKKSKEKLERYSESLEEVIAERTHTLEELARNDGLTGLLNQKNFYDELRKELARGQRRNHSTTLLYFDLDGFKALNDSQGHKRGSDILVLVADALKKTLRNNDIGARYGGDEFCIILTESSLGDAASVYQRLKQHLHAALTGTGVTCSVGAAISTPANSLTDNALVRLADQAMYKAKQTAGFSLVQAEQ